MPDMDQPNVLTAKDQPVVSNGYDQYNDTDVQTARHVFSIVVLTMAPFHIVGNLLTIIAIYVFQALRSKQNLFVASTAKLSNTEMHHITLLDILVRKNGK